MSKVKPILDYAIGKWASDIHISEGDYVWFRIHGQLGKLTGAGKLDKETTHKIVLELMNWNKEDYNTFMKDKDMDFAFVNDDGTPFRINAFFKLGKIGVVMRRIAAEPIPMEKLWLPEGIKKFTKAKQGLILVTGPTGSGKSTSMISVLDTINAERREHILTIEDPVEFIFEDKQSIFSQREIGRDSKSFEASLRAAMREDPDIIVVWEMRDRETVEAAMELAETGHLVISTMHTSGSVQTITRLVNFFPPDIQNSVQYKLADILYWVLSQRLIPKPDGSGRQGIYEVMFMTSWIKNLIRTGEFNQINNAIEMGSNEWMVRMRTYAERLEAEGKANKSDFEAYFEEDF